MSGQWISEDPIHVVVRNEEPALHDTQGRLVKPAQRRVYAKFNRGTAPGWASEIGVKSFEFRRMPERGIAKEQWLAYYDVREDAQRMGWTEEEQEAIISRLEEVVHAVLPVEPPRLSAPWPAYDKLVPQGKRTIDMVAAKIVEKVEEDGYNPVDVLEYEKQNLNRVEVVVALEALIAPVAEGETEVSVAA